MQTQQLQELIAFCEERKLGDLATGLKQELKTVRKSSSATFKPLAKSNSGGGKAVAAGKQPDKENLPQKRILKVI